MHSGDISATPAILGFFMEAPGASSRIFGPVVAAGQPRNHAGAGIGAKVRTRMKSVVV